MRNGILNGLLWLAFLLTAYVFSSGPVTRYFPIAADRIYAPLSFMADNPATGPLLRRWIKSWGVDTGEAH